MKKLVMDKKIKFLCFYVNLVFCHIGFGNYGLDDTSYSSDLDFHKQLKLRFSASKTLQPRFTKGWIWPYHEE